MFCFLCTADPEVHIKVDLLEMRVARIEHVQQDILTKLSSIQSLLAFHHQATYFQWPETPTSLPSPQPMQPLYSTQHTSLQQQTSPLYSPQQPSLHSTQAASLQDTSVQSDLHLSLHTPKHTYPQMQFRRTNYGLLMRFLQENQSLRVLLELSHNYWPARLFLVRM